MIKILHIISGLKNGGAEAILFRVVTEKGNNYKHEVISLSGHGYYCDIIAGQGIKVTVLNISSFGSLLRSFFVLIKHIRSAKPDLVQTWMYHADLLGGLAAKFAGIKMILWGVHSTFLNPQETKTSTKAAVVLSKWLSYIVPSKIICCSETALKSHAEIGYCSRKLIVVNNGFDTDLFKSIPVQRNLTRKSLLIGDHVFVIGMIARWHPVKDHEVLLKALSELKSSCNFEWKCILAGEGIDHDNRDLNRMIHHYGLENSILCIGSIKNISSIFNSLDLHILSSSAESYGNVTAEAMSCTIPCIMTDVGEAANLLSETGWIIPIRDSTRLAEQIKKVYIEFLNKEAWELRKARSRQIIIDKYSIKKMISGYEKAWVS
jgi:glycosyltransferase involved in cell wall biosynthesis